MCAIEVRKRPKPRFLHSAANQALAFASAPAALNGTSGLRVSRLRTSSIAQNTPRPRHHQLMDAFAFSFSSSGPLLFRQACVRFSTIFPL